MNITRDELRAAVEEAHKRGLKVTATCARSVIAKQPKSIPDNLEHGLLADSEFVADKQPDKCPAPRLRSLRQLDINSEAAKTNPRFGREERGYHVHAAGV